MGEAKRKGTFEERKAAAIKRDVSLIKTFNKTSTSRRKKIQTKEFLFFASIFAVSQKKFPLTPMFK